MGANCAFRFASTSQTSGRRIRLMKPGVKALSRFRSTVAFALMLWCAGAGCMLVSYAHGAAMSGANLADSHSHKQKLSDASASMGAHACCKARRSSSKATAGASMGQTGSHLESFADVQQIALPEAPGSSDATSCCPLTSGSFVVASRSQSNDDNAARADQRGSFLPTLTNSQPAPRSYPLRLPDQNQTYLRGCVFLI
jgi:hypothetical protein